MQVPEAWKEVALDEITEVKNSNVDKKSYEGQKSVKLCNYMDVYRNEKITSKIQFMEATAKDLEIDKFQLRVNDVIFTKDSETPDDIANPTVVVENIDNLICGYHLTLLRPFEDKCYGPFLSKLIASEKAHKQFEISAVGSTRFGLGLAEIKKVKLSLPPLPEQKKIAEILSACDECIENTEKQIAKLKDLKKATMQELLTKGIGHTEFKDSPLGRIPKSWQEVALDEITEVKNSNVDKKSYEGQKSVKLCNYMDVYRNEKITSKIQFMEATAKDSEIDKFQLRVNDVIFTKDSETPDDIANPTVVVENIDNLICGYHLTLLRPFEDKCYGPFLSKLIASEKAHKQFEISAVGSTRFGLGLAEIKKVKLSLPPLLEQKKIAGILSSIDSNIENKEQKLSKLKDQKKALMNDLLTGKVRVKL